MISGFSTLWIELCKELRDHFNAFFGRFLPRKNEVLLQRGDGSRLLLRAIEDSICKLFGEFVGGVFVKRLKQCAHLLGVGVDEFESSIDAAAADEGGVELLDMVCGEDCDNAVHGNEAIEGVEHSREG